MKLRPWLLAAPGLAAFGALVWFAGPLLSIGDRAPLASREARGTLIVAFVLVYLAHKALAAGRARRRNDRVLRELAPPSPAIEPAEVAQLRRRFSAAIETLRHTRFGARGGFWSSLSWKFGRQYLYQLPWYLIIGAPGAGKTTALLNSGLQFPLAGQFGRGSIKGVGGTRNCDWWFTDRAVLLDTAGRYTTHEADRLADRQAWEGFLALLTRARPRRPLNGALVAVSITDLQEFGAVERTQYASTLRARLDEIRSAIGARIPVYLLVTKCDLLPGFLDTFLALDRHGREQVWGTTFDLVASNRGRAIDAFPAAFDQLTGRLQDGLVERLQGERDPQRRARIFAFPHQFASMREPLTGLVRRVFGPGTDGVDGARCLRGIYFTSGTQEGTPIDRTLSALGRELGLERQILPPNQSTGKSFFLTSLLRDVVFAEAEIAGRSPAFERWRTRAITALLVSVQFAGALLAAHWLTSYTRSSGEIEQVAREVDRVRAQVQASDTRPGTDPRPLLPALNAVRELSRSTLPDPAAEAGYVPAFRRQQRLKLAAAAHQAYDRMLSDALLPRVVVRAEEQMRSGADPNLQYEALKAYTMLHEPAHFDAAALKAFVTYEWDYSLEPPLGAEDRAQLVQHLDALLDAGAAGAETADDPKLVQSVRARIAHQPMAQRVATRLKAILGTGTYPDFGVAALGRAGAALFVGRDGRSEPRVVPGRFTLAAYRENVFSTLPQIASQLSSEAGWVLATAPTAAAAASAAAPADVEALAAYLDDYARSWTDFIDDLRLRRAGGAAEATRQAQVLAAPDGPLAGLVRTVAQQTAPTHEASGAGALGQAALPLERALAERFEPLRQLLARRADGRRPLDAVLADFHQLHVLLALSGSDQHAGGASEDMPGWLARVQSDARLYPQPVRSMLLELVPPEASLERPTAAAAPSPQVAALAATACAQAVPGRFPFDRGSSREISIEDFNRLFGPAGLFDHVAAEGSTAAKAAARLASAQRIRDVFFAGRRSGATLRLTFRAHDMDDTIDRFELHIDGQVVRYAHGPTLPTVITWPGPAPGARIEMTPAPPAPAAPEFSGTWALFRLMDRVPVESIGPGRFRIVFNLAGRRASFDVESESGANPFRMPELERFDCPPNT
jgi:type VI secretion system protein ImpL